MQVLYRTGRRARGAALSRGALLTGAATSILALAASHPALAQDDTAAAEQAIVVTGTRIPNRDYSSYSPISTVSGDLLKSTGTLSPDQLLNTLPQVVPGLTAGSNNPPGNGQASIDLRGLGPNRTVVLVDGRRAMPSNSDGTVDLQTIPQSLISRIEVITGGASAVYGPDAVAGVVNFVLKDNFEGVQFDGQYGISGRGDDNEVAVGGVVGAGTGDGRGHVVLAYDYANRKQINDGARGFASQATSPTSRSPTGSYVPGASNPPTQAAIDNYFAAHAGSTGPYSAGGVKNTDALGFNDNGSLFDFGGGNGPGGVFNFNSNPIFPAALFCADAAKASTCRTYSYNFQPPNLMILPLDRHNFMGLGHYKINDAIDAYTQISFTQYDSASSLAPTPAPTSKVTAPDGTTSGSAYVAPYNNPLFPADLKALLATRANPTGDVSIVTRFLQLGPRLADEQNNALQFTAGLRGDLPFKLHYDVFGTFGRLDLLETQFGNVSNSEVEKLLWGGTTGACAGWTGLDFFGSGKISPACAADVQRVTKNSTKTTFNTLEGDLSGELFDLPAGSLKFNLGSDYREQDFGFLPDPLLTSGDISGFNASKAVAGAVYDKEVYGELYVPIVADKPFAESISATLGARYTDHTKSGGLWTYKAEGDWGIAGGFRVRGSYEHAVRAPNINELFSASFQDNPELVDPCSTGSPFLTGPHAAQVAALCAAQGVPPGFVQPNGQIQATSGGNPDVKAETADTYTVGGVWQSRIENPLLAHINASLDYWNIDLKKPIGIDAAGILYGCFNADGSNPTYSNSNANCKRIIRSSSTISYISAFQTNLGFIKTSGIDVALDWSFDIADAVGAKSDLGKLTFDFSGTYLLDYTVKNGPLSTPFQYSGTIGVASPIGINTDGALPKWKGQLTTSWSKDAFTLSTRLNYVDAMRNSAELVLGKGAFVAPFPVGGVPATWYLDVFGQWAVTNNVTLRAGVTNATDQQPRLYNPSQQDGTDPSTYDVIGRRYFVGLNLKY
jgi:outer membrane receptor protein involved in Fe transport